ncbi:hypothetical protein [Synechococcus sp. PCC 7336]|uniref:hypothetical protein n=1 Tax=Synechococcus sp. PCC 7336 TaxID=195250 RepID=UPI000348AD9E|nr:hypothetical protein [Synechococcus sp. PCC 7336]
MNALIQISLMALLASSIRLCATAGQWIQVGAIAAISIPLWLLLDGLWQTPWLFTTLEPALLAALQVGILLGYTRFGLKFARQAIATFLLAGAAIAAAATTWGSPNTYGIEETFNAGIPILIAAIATVSIYQVLASSSPARPSWAAMAIALASGLAIDSFLYVALSSAIPLWQSAAWVKPLGLKLADKLVLAIGIAVPIVAIEMSSLVDIFQDLQPRDR